jgi:hypothetical protein
MVQSPRKLALIAFALFLMTAPIWAPPLEITGREYEYSAALVTVEDNRIQIPRDPPRPQRIDGISCFGERFPSRLCGFESGLLDGTSRAAPYPGVRHVSGSPSLAAQDQYLAFSGDGRVFRRVTRWNESSQSYRLRLERVSARQALSDISNPIHLYPEAVREAARTGTSQSTEDLQEAVVVESSGRYYAVYPTSTESFLAERPGAERVLELLAIVGGAALLMRARSVER